MPLFFENPANNLESALDNMYPLLRENSKFIYVDRIVYRKKKDIIKLYKIHRDYKLNKWEVEENLAKYKATFRGNREIGLVYGNERMFEADSRNLPVGELLTERLFDRFHENGFKLGILTIEFEKKRMMNRILIIYFVISLHFPSR